jgi:hemolysin III
VPVTTAGRATGKGAGVVSMEGPGFQAVRRGRARAQAADGRGMVSASEELVPRLRGVSHAVASVLAVAAAVVVITLAHRTTSSVAVGVYGVGLIALFAGSALYHRWPGSSRFKPLLKRIDHSTIYAFIAASYTPIAVVLLHGALAWVILVVAWAGAAGGVALALGWIEAPRVVVAGSYLALGWIALIALPQLLQHLSLVPLVLLGAGGLLYSAGAIVYASQRPDPWPRTFGFHEIFHALVILAAAAQYVAIAGWVVPAS